MNGKGKDGTLRGLICCGVVCCTWIASAACAAQQLTTKNVEFEAGEFQMVAPYMSQLLQLVPNRDELRFSRQWKDPLHEKSREAIVEMVIGSLTSRDNISEEEAVDLAEWIVKYLRDTRTGDNSNFGKAVRAIAMFTTTEMSSGGTVSGRGEDNAIQLVSNGMSFDGFTNIDTLSFDFEENVSPFRKLHVDDFADGRMIIQVLGTDYVVQLSQRPNGKFHVVYLSPELATSFTAANFATFQKNHSAIMEQWLDPLLRHYGIGLPAFLGNKETERIIADVEASAGNRDKDRETEWRAEGVFFDSAGLQLAKDYFERLIKLSRSDQKILLDRKFQEFGGRPSPDQMRKSMRAQMEKIHADAAAVDAMMARVRDEDLPPPEQKPLRQAFEEFRIEGSRRSGGGSTGGGQHFRLRNYNNELDALGTNNGKRISLRFSEKRSPRRTLVVSDSGEGDFSLTIFSEVGLIDVRQFQNGIVRVSRFEDDQIHSVAANNFAEFVSSHPKTARDWLFPLLKHYGILWPDN